MTTCKTCNGTGAVGQPDFIGDDKVCTMSECSDCAPMIKGYDEAVKAAAKEISKDYRDYWPELHETIAEYIHSHLDPILEAKDAELAELKLKHDNEVLAAADYAWQLSDTKEAVELLAMDIQDCGPTNEHWNEVSARKLIHTYIDPIVEKLKTEVHEWRCQSDGLMECIELQRHELAELKAMVRKYMPEDDRHDRSEDWNPANRIECYECGKEFTDNQYYCQNPECPAYRLRRASAK